MSMHLVWACTPGPQGANGRAIVGAYRCPCGLVDAGIAAVGV
jgi:hypothetical protein